MSVERIAVEIREKNGELRGTILQEGRAASGGRSEVFTPGSVRWPATGIAIRAEHLGASETLAVPKRDKRGRIRIRVAATEEIRKAIRAGKRHMSVEFRCLDERTTKGGVREVLRALVEGAALVARPEYDSTAAEVRKASRPRYRAVKWL